MHPLPFTEQTVVTTVVIMLLGTFILIRGVVVPVGVGVVVRPIGVVGPVVEVVPVIVPPPPTVLKTPFLSATTVTSRMRTRNISITLATAMTILQFKLTAPSSPIPPPVVWGVGGKK